MSRFTPTFLQKIDKDWLLNQPEIWATRIHHLLFWGALYVGGLSLLGMLYPVSSNNVPDTEASFAIGLFSAAFGFLYWVYQVSLYRPQEQFGNLPTGYSVKEIGIYLAGIVFLMSGSFFFSKQIDTKSAHVVSKSRLIEDVNRLNIGYIYFANRYDIQNAVSSENYIYPHYTLYPQEEFEGALTAEEFSYKVRNVQKDKKTQLAQIENYIESYNRYTNDPILASPQEVLNGFNAQVASISAGETTDNNIDESAYYHDTWQVDRVIGRIAKAKTHHSIFYDWEFYGVMSILSGILGLSFLVFLRLGLRKFIMTILTGVVLMFASGLFVAFINGRDGTVAGLFGVEWVAGILLALTLRHTHKTQVIKQVLLSLAIMTMPFLPLAFLVMADTHLGSSETPFIVMGTGLILTFVGWLTFFNNKMIENYAKPKVS